MKRLRLVNWIRIHQPTICCLQETHLTHKDSHTLKVKGQEKAFHANRHQKQGGSYSYIRQNKLPKQQQLKKTKRDTI